VGGHFPIPGSHVPGIAQEHARPPRTGGAPPTHQGGQADCASYCAAVVASSRQVAERRRLVGTGNSAIMTPADHDPRRRQGADMLLGGSEKAGVGFVEGMRVLRAGGRALDAVEAPIRRVESNPADHSVGYGGLPNILGEVELDASLMDGRSLEAGA